MSRKPRKESKSKIYHIILRGNNKQSLFFDDNDRQFFLNRLNKYSKQLDIHIFSYCLMQNHVHILLGNAPKENLSLFVQKLANSYVYYFNRKYECSGHLFQGRFKSEPVEDEIYLKNVLRYILMNPEKANISKMPDFRWSSYKDTILSRSQTFIDRKFITDLFSSQKSIKQFLSVPDNNIYMEYENKVCHSDEKAALIIKETCCVINPFHLRSFSPEEINIKIKILKKHALSISQISRLTGIPRRIISEA